MFIPIHAKQDVQNSKKGKMSPAQSAIVNAFALSKKTGIFRALGKCEASVSSPIANDVIVTFDRGFFAVCGRIVEVEKGSEVKIRLPARGSVEGRIVARFELSSSHEEEFKVLVTSDLPIQQDLNSNPTSGRYDFVLYQYTAEPNRVLLHPRDESIYIDDFNGRIEELYDEIKSGEKVVKVAKNFDPKQGTIAAMFESMNRRIRDVKNDFDHLVYEVGTISGIDSYSLYRVGRYAILELKQGALIDNTCVMSFYSKRQVVNNVTTMVNGNLILTIEENTIKTNFANPIDARGVSLGFEVDVDKEEI